MSLAILDAIKKKKEQFPLLNQRVIEGHVPGILRNFREIKGRKYNRSVIYRQVKRDDYHQPSRIESLFDFWAAVSFGSKERGELMIAEIASWAGWRETFEPNVIVCRDFWAIEENLDHSLSDARKAHLLGDVNGERAALLRIKAGVSSLLLNTTVPADASAKAIK